jgi:hypothetical protein
MKAETCPEDGVMYWAYILIYVDDIVCVHQEPGTPLAKLDEYFKMKGGSTQVPAFFLGAKPNKTVSSMCRPETYCFMTAMHVILCVVCMRGYTPPTFVLL